MDDDDADGASHAGVAEEEADTGCTQSLSSVSLLLEASGDAASMDGDAGDDAAGEVGIAADVAAAVAVDVPAAGSARTSSAGGAVVDGAVGAADDEVDGADDGGTDAAAGGAAAADGADEALRTIAALASGAGADRTPSSWMSGKGYRP